MKGADATPSRTRVTPHARSRRPRVLSRGEGTPSPAFDRVKAIGLTLPNVDAATRYDGSPVLKLGGCFMAGLASHPAAEPDSLIVRFDLDERASLLDDAPETYYVTEYYQPYPVVLARLSRLEDDALRELLAISRRLTLPKTRRRDRISRRARSLSAAGSRASSSPRDRSARRD